MPRSPLPEPPRSPLHGPQLFPEFTLTPFLVSDVHIGDTNIKQDSEGRYCLNDLHRAAGGEQKHQPNRWLRSEQAQELTEVISKCPDLGISPLDAKRENGGGTFVTKELVYAYAMWISPKFHLQVIRAYDGLVTGTLAPAPVPAPSLISEQLAAMQVQAMQVQAMQIMQQLTHTHLS